MPDPIAPVRVIIADDHAIVLHGLETLFRSQGDFEVVACCRSGDEALAALRRGGADVLVLDLRMPGTSGLDVLRTMAAERIACRTVVLTAAVSDAAAAEALQLGALGLVLKESTPDALVECVRRVHAGERHVDSPTMHRAFDRMLRREAASREASDVLTPRELEIVRMIAQGHRNKVVAERLSISEGTVKIHLHRIYQKLGIDGRLELAIWVRERGLD